MTPRSSLATLPYLVLAACATAPGIAPPSLQTACAGTRLPENPRFGPSFTDKFHGVYTAGGLSVRVTRIGAHRLVIHRGNEVRDLATEDLNSWQFTDACGARYVFNLPPDGPGGWLKITDPGATTRDWHRTGY